MKTKLDTTWKDTSSYSQGERGKVEPTAWDLDLDGLRVTVHRLHLIDGLWFGSCHAMGVERKQLTFAELKDAQVEFLAYLIARAENWTKKLREARHHPVPTHTKAPQK